MPSKKLRVGRRSLPGQIYHITTSTEGRRPLFRDFTHARIAVAELRRLHEQNVIDSLAWVLMPDHLHWLFQLRGPIPLSTVVKVFKGRSARQLGTQTSIDGVVWQAGFHDHGLRRDEDLLKVARYIVSNPLRAGLVEQIGDYPFWDAHWL
ncbi:transposase [Metapseudomonas lalkuanensis]|uniref:REP-associated tyrosine transposase n=1 Tax=Metapseudomonas lalkuanensis TaxID=2604832 RepID=UPI001CF33171|nr:transposase [Pseudomonas lalkuanensis]UCO98581.1 transposase [Pseudomonas lalkuanensis]